MAHYHNVTPRNVTVLSLGDICRAVYGRLSINRMIYYFPSFVALFVIFFLIFFFFLFFSLFFSFFLQLSSKVLEFSLDTQMFSLLANPVLIILGMLTLQVRIIFLNSLLISFDLVWFFITMSGRFLLISFYFILFFIFFFTFLRHQNIYEILVVYYFRMEY